MFSKLSDKQLESFIPLFKSKPKFALFANAAKFELEKRIPGHPCDFYYLEVSDSKYFFVFRHDNVPDACRPILMIGSDETVHENDVIHALEQIKQLEPDLGIIEMLIAPTEVSIPARRFFIENYNREDYNVPCHNFYLPDSVTPEIHAKVEGITLPSASYSIGSTRIADSEVVYSTWKFRSAEGVLQIKEIIQCLPTVCIFHEEKAVAFEIIGLHGQLNHQFTFPEFRNRGLGSVVENTIVAKCFREGIRVAKSIEIANDVVLSRCKNHKLWKIVQEDNGEDIVFDYTHYH